MLNIIMQTSPAAGPESQLPFFMMLGMMFLIFYFLMIRPQNKRMKEHKAMLAGVTRGDKIVTSGGLIGKVTKVADGELTVDLGDGVKVKVMPTMIADIMNKKTPANDTAKK